MSIFDYIILESIVELLQPPLRLVCCIVAFCIVLSLTSRMGVSTVTAIIAAGALCIPLGVGTATLINRLLEDPHQKQENTDSDVEHED
jgi:hypothetical protein